MNRIDYSFANRDDERQIRELLKESELPDEDISPHLPHFILAKKEKLLVGCVGLELAGNSALLRSLAVLPNFRSQGIAAELCRRVTDHARMQGYDSLYLLTTTADIYFQRIGYERLDRSQAPVGIAETEQFRNLCPSSAVLMKANI